MAACIVYHVREMPLFSRLQKTLFQKEIVAVDRGATGVEGVINDPPLVRRIM